ncbi:MAG: GGDEF and EAL domain-containing protein [Aquificota bacterium]|nr:GGDEF and EAL domain-containing protein [Aquificota bacterium]
MRLRSRFQTYTLALIFLLVLSTLLAFLFHYLPRVTQKSKEEAERLLAEEVSTQLSNVIDQMTRIARGERLDSFLQKSEDWRWFLERKLEVLLTNHIRNIYLVYKRDSLFDFLIFVSSEREEPDYSLISLHGDSLEYVFREGKPLLIKREKFITLLKPVRAGKDVVAVLGADFSPARFTEVEESIDLMRDLVGGGAMLITLLLLLLAFVTVRSGIIERKLFVDPLTGVYNRNLLSRIHDFIDLRDYGLLIVDVDNFKRVNDVYGHDTGDLVLKAIAGRIGNLIKKDRDLVVRYGGEEFLVFVRKNGDPNRPALIGERIRKGISGSPVIVNGGPIRVSVSVGVLSDVSEERNLEEAIRKADMALYTAKRKGKDRVEVYSDKERAYVLPFWEVRQAVEEGRVEFLYQPVRDLETGEILMLEALARLRDREGNLHVPDSFLPSIKGTDAYTSLTKLAVYRNLEVLRDHENLKVSVNLEVSHLLSADLVEFVEEAVRELMGGDCGKRFFLEILEYEDYPLQEMEGFVKNVRRLKDLGIGFIVDDFGSGYANFLRIVNLDLDYVKISGDLIKDLSDTRIKTLCRAIVEFCRGLGTEVIAESVSSEEILRSVREIGIRFGQGFHLGKPATLDQILTRS